MHTEYVTQESTKQNWCCFLQGFPGEFVFTR